MPADELVVQERRQVELPGRVGPVADDDVEATFRQRPLVVVLRPERMKRETRVRGAPAQRLDHARQERHDDVIGTADLERLLRRRRRELVAFNEQFVGFLQRDARRGVDLQCPLGRDHPGVLPHQQRIVEDGAQSLQCDADRRLRLIELDRSARHAALGQHGAQHAQEIRVERIAGAAQR